MSRQYIAIDLSTGQGETILPDTFSGIDAEAVVRDMRASVPDDVYLPENVSLSSLVHYSRPLLISDHLRERLVRQSPELLEKLKQWQEQDQAEY